VTGVLAKLSGLSAPAKVALAVTVAVVAGVVGYLVLGPTAGGLAGLGGLITTAGKLFRRQPRLSDSAGDLAREHTQRQKADAAAAREVAAAKSRDRAAARDASALDRARAAGADDGGDPRRVLDRQRGSR